MRPEKMVNHIGKILKTGQELRMTSQIGDYDMDYIIMDLGSLRILSFNQYDLGSYLRE